MVWTLPPFSDLENEHNRTKKIYNPNISQNTVYQNIYDIKPRIVTDTSETRLEENISIFRLPLSVIIKNIANTLLLILIDLTNVNSYSNINNFLKVFMVENRLMYFGIFIIIVSLYILLFFT